MTDDYSKGWKALGDLGAGLADGAPQGWGAGIGGGIYGSLNAEQKAEVDQYNQDFIERQRANKPR
jgi:hypothetical protein